MCNDKKYFNLCLPKKVLNLINYIEQNNQITDPCIEIYGNSNDNLSDVKESYCIQLNSNVTESLFKSNLLKSDGFLQITSNFSNFCIEVQYPSKLFKYINLSLHALKKMKKIQKISLYCNEMKIDNQNWGFEKDFNYVKFNSSVKAIGWSCFQGFSIIQVSIPSSITKIEHSTFSYCSLLEQVIIPSSVRTIYDNAFQYCTSLKQISIPSSVTDIGKGCFADCTSLTHITLPQITRIEDHLFNRCNSLQQIEIPSSVTYIGVKAFSQCSALQQIEIPSSVNLISTDAFTECVSLEQVKIYSSSITVESDAFYYCTALKTVTIPSSTKINIEAFPKYVEIKRV